MSCDFFDFGCHGKNLLTGWWFGLEWWMQAGIVIGVLLMIYGGVTAGIRLVRGIAQWFHKIGGWPAVAGAVIVVLVFIASIATMFLPKKPKTEPVDTDEIWPHPDKPRKVTAPKKPRAPGKRRYDPNLNEWVEK